MRLAKVVLVAMFVVATPLAAQKADAKAEVMATVRQFLNGFNKSDMKTAAAACAVPISIIDEFPPHLWQGPNACMDWSRDFEINAKANAITDPVVKITKVASVDVTGDRAYVVTKASYDWKEKGKAMKERDATWTFAMQKVAAGWRITGWAWSKH